MSSYGTLIDYLGDLRPPERLTTPPGGSLGAAADAYLCDIAQTARTIPSKGGKLALLRHEAAVLSRMSLPAPLAGREPAIIQRLADWADELRVIADNSNGGRSCMARY